MVGGLWIPIHTNIHYNALPLRQTSMPTYTSLRRRPYRRCWERELARMSPSFSPRAKFDLSELLGGRGLCNGEQGLQKEIINDPQNPNSFSPPSLLIQQKQHSATTTSSPSSFSSPLPIDAFEKELFGLTGGFPGGEKGIKQFIQLNPPPREDQEQQLGLVLSASQPKPKPPTLPLFLPGMMVLVKNPKNPFHMYCGIVQRVTDGKVGVLFEGGNWDKLISFDLHELERRDKGPPMVSPKSPVLESLVQKLDS